jgi:hydrogenase maturation protein HypF
MSEKSSARIHVSGIVQGVGFRPFVYNLAKRLAICGWVRNTSAGVDISVDGSPDSIEAFIQDLRLEAPPLAVIDHLEYEATPFNGFSDFEIIPSEPLPGAYQPISPDVGICPDCLREIFDPNDRRYRYPFTNCTNCGPRLTIITDIPYDRPNTTMAHFKLCPSCSIEYHAPQDRRFHAQPVACPSCGPKVWLKTSTLPECPEEGEAIRLAQELLAEGKIVAIKGLGGFHLACDAQNTAAVEELRRRKMRSDKPFALMMPELDTIRQNCCVSPAEAALLESHQRPIVLLDRLPGSRIATNVAPNQKTLGVMLPYTPLHYLLFAPPPDGETQPVQILVMTSGNMSEEPIATDNEEAERRLSVLADAFLMHDRPIHTRCDDSVIRLSPHHDRILHIRRSRGYAPSPLHLPWKAPPLLAAGPELKNTFCLVRDSYAFMSHHIGDMQNYETLQSYESSIEHYERLFRIRPEALAYDLHPDYLATRYALTRASGQGLPALGIQHHHAHIAACMVDNGLDGSQPVIGISFDGTGYGSDGHIWGGEFLIADYLGFRRAAHLSYLPLPGGDSAILCPARIALAYLWHTGMDWQPELPPVDAMCVADRSILRAQLNHNINTPLTSSMGRLFDAVAALIGIRQLVNYEAQAAIELENLVDPDVMTAYHFDLPVWDHLPPAGGFELSPKPLLEEVIEDFLAGKPLPLIAARFHNGITALVLEVCLGLRQLYGIKEVALSGGVWQNKTLLCKALPLLEDNGFIVYTHLNVPPNDGGIALGQAAIAAQLIKSSEQPKSNT